MAPIPQNPNNPQNQTNQKYQPNVANIPVTPEAPPAAADVVKKDYFGLKLRGLQDEDIWAYSNQENNDRQKQGLSPVTVTLDKEQSWNIYKDDVYKGDRNLFEQQWKTVSNDYNSFKEKKEEDLYHAWNDKQLEDPRPQRYSIQGELPMGRKFEEFQTVKQNQVYLPKGYAFDSYGQLMAIKSQEQVAEDLGKVYDPNLGKMITMDEWKKEAVKDLNFTDALFSGYLTMPKVPTLVLDYDQTGDITGEVGTPFWKSASNEDRLKGSAVRSLWGPRSIRNNWLTDFFGEGLNSLIFNVPSTFGSAMSNSNALLSMATGNAAFQNLNLPNVMPSWLKDKGNQMQNMSSQLYFKESERQLQGIDGQGWRTAGSLVGLIAQAALLKRVSMPAGLSIAEATGASEIAAQQIGARIASTGNHVFFGLMMADGMNQAAKEAGVSEDRASAVYGVSLVATLGLMGRFSKLFAPGEGVLWQRVFANAEAKNVVQKSFAPIFKETLANTVKNTGKEASQLSANALASTNKFSVLKTISNLAKKTGNVTPIVSSPIISMGEFAALHIVNNAITSTSDYLYLQDNPDADEIYTQTGQGLYNDPKKGLGEKLTEGIGHSFLTGFVMGLHGGIDQYVAGRKNPELLMKNRSLSDYVMTGKQDKIFNVIENMHKAGEFGDKNINSLTLEEYKPEDVDPATGERPASLNDVNYASARKSLESYISVYEQSGIKQWHQNAKDKGKRYLKDYFDKSYSALLDKVIDPTQVAKEAVEIIVRRNEIQERLKDTTITDNERVQLEKELSKKTELIADFEETVRVENATKQKRISKVEAKAVRSGMLTAHYFSAKDKDGNPLFNIFNPKVSSFKTEFGDKAITVGSDTVDALNESLKKVIDPAVIAQQRGENTNELTSILADMQAGVTPELIGRIQNLHNSNLRVGVDALGKTAFENMLNEVQNKYSEVESQLMKEISDKYKVDYDEETATINDVALSVPGESKAEFDSLYKGKINSLRELGSINEQMSADANSVFEKGNLTPRQILENAYISVNRGTAEEPRFVSFEDILSKMEQSDFSNPNDAAMLDELINNIASNAEILAINDTVYSKLDNQVSGLNENITPLKSDLDPTNKGSIHNKLVESFNKAIKLKFKALNISSVARQLFDANFVLRDADLRNNIAQRTIDHLTIITGGYSKDFKDALQSANDDLIKYVDTLNEQNAVADRAKDLNDKLNRGEASDAEKEEYYKKKDEIASLVYKSYGHIVSAESKLHDIFNSKEGNGLYERLVKDITNTFAKGKKGTELEPLALGAVNSKAKEVKDENNRYWYYGDVQQFESSLASDNISLNAHAYTTFIQNITNIKRLSPKSFLERYNAWNEYSKTKNPNHVALSFEQQKAVYESVAFLMDPSISGAKVSTKTAKLVPFLENTLSVLGFAGVGKTKVMLPAIMDIYHSVKKAESTTFKFSNIVFTAAHSRQVENLKSSIESISINAENKESVSLEQVLNGKVDKLTDTTKDRILVIDEASELTIEQVETINKQALEKGFKVIQLIDESQISSGETFTPPGLTSQRTTPVTDVHRSGVYDIVRIQQAFREPYVEGGKEAQILYPSTQYSESESGYATKGVKLRGNEFKAQKEQLDSFVSDLKKDGVTGKTVFIVATDADRLELINTLSSSGIDKSVLEGSVRTMLGDKTTAKGFQFERVYVNIKKGDIFDITDYHKVLLTASSRAESYLDIITTVPESEVVSQKVDTLFTDKSDYVEKSKEAYTEYANRQPELINEILSHTTQQVNLTREVKEPAPAVQEPPVPTASQAANNVNQQTQYSGSNPGNVVFEPVPIDSYEDYWDGDSQGGFVDQYFGKSMMGPDGNQLTVSGIKKAKNSGDVLLTVTDGVNTFEIKPQDFKQNDPILSGIKDGGIQITSIADENTPSQGKEYETLTKAVFNQNSLANARVGSLFVKMHSDAAIQDKYVKEKTNFFQKYIYSIAANSGQGRAINNYLRKIYINNLALEGSSERYQNGIYHVLDLEGVNPKIKNELFGTENPTLVNGRYFIFSHEYGFDEAYRGLDVTSVPATESPADYFNRLYSSQGLNADKLSELNINRMRFVDRVEAYRKLSGSGDNQVVDLGSIAINKVTNGNYVPEKGREMKISEITKTKKTVTKEGVESVEEQISVPKQKVNGWYPHEMEGKTVYFSDPYLIYDPSKQGLGASRIPKYTDQNGNRVFEPGYYIYYTLNPNSNNSNVGMIKIKSTQVSKADAVGFVKDYFGNTKRLEDNDTFRNNGFYEDINRFITSNRYFFDQYNTGNSLYSINKRTDVAGGKSYNNYEVQVFDPNTKTIDLKATYERMQRIQDIIEKNYDENTSPVKIRSFPSSNTTGSSKFAVNSHDQLFTDVKNVNFPQIVVSSNEVKGPSATEKTGEAPGTNNMPSHEFSSAQEDSLFDDLSEFNQKESEPSTDADPLNFVTNKQLSRDKKASNGISKLSTVFGNEQNVAGIVNTISKEIVTKSRLSRSFDPFYFQDGLSDIPQAIEMSYSAFMNKYESIKDSVYNVSDPNATEAIPTYKTPDELTWNDVVTSKSEDVRRAYIYAQLAKGKDSDFREVFDPIIKKIFPQNILLTTAEARNKFGDTDLDENIGTLDVSELTTQSSISTSATREGRNPVKGYSSQMRLILNSLDYREFSKDESGNIISRRSKTPITPENVISAFNSITKNVGFLPKGENNFDSFRRSIERAMEATQPKEGNEASNQYNILSTIYDAFFRDSFPGEFGFYDPSTQGEYSYYDWIKNPDKILERINSDAQYRDVVLPEGVSLEELFNIKRNFANYALNEFFAVSGSANQISYQNDLYIPIDGSIRVFRPKRNTVSDIKDRIAKNMTTSLFDIFDGVATIKGNKVNRVSDIYLVDYVENGEPKSMSLREHEINDLRIRQERGEIQNLKQSKTPQDGYRIDDSGIYITNKGGGEKQIIKRTATAGEFMYEFADPSDFGGNKKNVSDILEFLGISKYDISGKTINTYLYGLANKTQINGIYSEPLSYEVDSSTLARMLHDGLSKLKIGFENKDLDFDTVNIDNENTDGSSELQLPIMEWKYRQDLAIVESFNRSTSVSNYFTSPSGERKYTIQNSSFLVDRISSPYTESDLNTKISDVFINDFQNRVSQFGEAAFENNPYYNLTYQFAYNPLYNGGSQEYVVRGQYVGDGAKRASVGKGVSQYSPTEIINSNIANYIEGLASAKKDGSGTSRYGTYYQYAVPHPVTGDSSKIFYIQYSVDKKSNASPIIIKDGNVSKNQKASAQTNWDYFSYSFTRELQKLRRDQVQSLDTFVSEFQRFINQSAGTPLEAFFADPTISLALTGRLETGKEGFLSKYNRNKLDLLDNPQEVQDFIDEVINSNATVKEAFMDFLNKSSSVSEYKHYKFVDYKDSQGNVLKEFGKRVFAGNSIRYKTTDAVTGNTMDPIFLLDNYKAIQKVFADNGLDIDSVLFESNSTGTNKINNENVNKELKKIFKNAFSRRIDSYVSSLFKNQVKVDQRTKPFFTFEGENFDGNNIEKAGFVKVVKRFTPEEWTALSENEKQNYLDNYYLNRRYNDKENYTFKEYNPFYESYVLAFANHGNHITDLTIGDKNQYPSYSSYAIRSYQITTPGLHYTIKPYGIGVKATQKAAIYNDSNMKSINRIAKLLGGSKTDSTTRVDGLEFQVGIDGIIQQFSLGQNIVKNAFGHKKEIHNQNDIVTGQRILMKSSTMNLKPYRKNSREIMDIERKMMSHVNFIDNGQSITLWNKLEEFGMDDAKLVDWMFEGGSARQVSTEDGRIIDIRDTYLSRLMPTTVAKTINGASVIDINAERYGEESTFDMDYNTRLYVLDLNKEARDQKASNPTQASTTLFVGQNNYNRTAESMSAMVENVSRVSDDISKSTESSTDVKSFVADRTKVAVGNRMEILNDPRFGTNLPGLTDPVRIAFANEFNKGIKPEIKSASSNVQYPGELVEMLTLTTDIGPYKAGKRMTLAQYDKFIQKYPDAANSFTKDNEGLRAMKAYVKSGDQFVDVESFDYLKDILTPEQIAENFADVDGVMTMVKTPDITPEQRNKIVSDIKQSGGKIEPYEVVMSFTNFRKFGLDDNPNSEFYYKKFDADDFVTLRLRDGSEVMYEDLGSSPEDRRMALAGLLNQLEGSLASDVLMKDNKIELSKNGEIKDRYQFADSMANYMEAFILTRDAFINRVPASKSSSGFKGKIVAFDNDISNTILVSSKKNIIDGSDYDIDELHVYHLDLPNYGENLLMGSSSGKIEEGEYESIYQKNPVNVVIKNAIDHYNDVDNLTSVTSPVSTDQFESVYEQIRENMLKKGNVSSIQAVKFLNDVVTNTRQFESFNAGVETPGIFANGIKVYSHIYHAFSKVKGDHFNINLLGKNYRRFFNIDPVTGVDSGHLTMDSLAGLLQAAVDNGKLDLLGRLRIDPTTASAAMAMKFAGVSDMEIVEFLSDYKVSNIINDIKAGRDIDEKSRNSQKVATSWMNMAETYKARIFELNETLKITTDVKKRNEIIKSFLEEVDNISKVFGTKSRYIPRKVLKSEADKAAENQEMAEIAENGGIKITSESSAKEELELDESIEYDLNRTIEWLNDYSQKARHVADVMALGRGLSKLAKVFSVNQGVKFGDWDTYDYLENLNELVRPDEYIRFYEKRSQKAMISGIEREIDIPSEYDLAKRENDLFKSFVNTEKLINKLPNIKSFINAWVDFDNKMQKVQTVQNPVFRNLDKAFLNQARKPRFYNKDEYGSAMSARWKVISTMYLEKYGDVVGLKNRINPNEVENVGTPTGQLEFIITTHDLIRDMQTNPGKYELTPGTLVDSEGNITNSFLKDVTVEVKENQDEYINLRDLNRADESYVGKLKDDLQAIYNITGIDLGKRLSVYSIITDGGIVRKGSVMSIVNKDNLVQYDDFLNEMNVWLNTDKRLDPKASNIYADNIAMRYGGNNADRLAVHMLGNLPSITKDSNTKNDFQLNEVQDKEGRIVYKGGLIPIYRTSVNQNAKDIADFPDYVQAWTPISGHITGKSAEFTEAYSTKKYLGAFKKVKIEDPEIVQGASKENPVYRYVRIDNKVSNMLSGWTKNSVAQEVFGIDNMHKSLHIVSMNRIKDLMNTGRTSINPNEITNLFTDVGRKYNNGFYYLKNGQIVELTKFQREGKTGFSLSIKNLQSANANHSEGVSADAEFSSADIIDFAERKRFIDSANGSDISNYNRQLNIDYLGMNDQVDVLRHVSENSLYMPHALLAKAMLDSYSSKKLSIGNIEFLSEIQNPGLFSMKDRPTKMGGVWRPVKDSEGRVIKYDIFINTDEADNSVKTERFVLHEMNHGITADVLQRFEKNQKLTNDERTYAQYITKLYEYTKSKSANKDFEYPFKNTREFVTEAFTHKSFQQHLMTIPAMNPEVAKMGIKDVWREFVSAVKNFFFSTAGANIQRTPEMESVFDEIMSVSSVYLEGDSMFEIALKDTYLENQMARVFNTDAEFSKANEEKGTPNEDQLKAYYGVGFKVDKVNDNVDLVSAMARTDVRQATNDVNNENAVNQLSNAIFTGMSYSYNNHGNYRFVSNGKVYELENLNNRDQIKDIAREIISKRGEYESKIKGQFRDYLMGADPQFDKNIESNKGWIKRKFAINPNDKISLLSDSGFNSSLFDTKTFDPFVVVSERDGIKYVSLMDMTTAYLNQRLTPSGNVEYLADFISKIDPTKIYENKFSLLKTQEGMRKFNLMLLAMSMKAKDPSIVFEKMSVIKPDGFHSESYDIAFHDYLKEMEYLLKSRVVYDIMSPELKALVDNPESFKAPEVNYVKSLLSAYHDLKERYFKQAEDNNEIPSQLIDKYEDIISRIQTKAHGHDIFSADVERVIINRINEIKRYYKNDEGKIVNNEEMKYLSDALFQIKTKGQKSIEKLTDIDSLGKYSLLNYNIGNPVFDMYRTDIMSAIETGKNRYMAHMKKMNALISDINKKYVNGLNGVIGGGTTVSLTDVGYKRFDRLFIKQKATDNLGNTYDVNTYYIHNSKNPRTIEALKKYEISKEEVALGDYIVETLKEAIITKKVNSGMKREDAENQYDANWKDGMVPIMQRRASEKIFSKDWRKGLSQWASKYSNSNNFFEYVNDAAKQGGTDFMDIFSNQLGDSYLGSVDRMSKIGLFIDNGAIKVFGSTEQEIKSSIEANENQVEKNLEVVMAYYMMNHYQKQEVDKTNAVYYAAQTLMHNYESKHSDQSTEGRLTNLREYMRKMAKFNVLGQRERMKGGLKVNTGSKVVDVKYDDMIRMTGAATSVGVLGGNILADFKNLMTNTLTLQSFAVSNSIAGAKNFYGLGDVNKAIALYSTNPKLAIALAFQYKMAGMDRSNLLNNERHFKTKKYLFSDRMLYMGQFAGDYLIRTLSMMAHMNKKGVLDAYSLDKEGNLVYDETKDARIYKEGKMTEDGKLLKVELLKNMQNEGVYDGDVSVDAKLPRAFDNRLRDSVKTITDKFITGGAYDDATALTLDAHSIGTMFTMFSKYLFDKAQNLYKEGYESSAIGDYIIKDVTIDNVTKKNVVFEGEYMEGLIQSVMGIYREARKTFQGVEYDGLIDMWKKQKDIRKMNISRVLHDAAISSMFLAILPALFNNDDENQNQYWRSLMSSPIGKSMNYSMLDLISGYSPNEYYSKAKEPFFAITQAGKYAEFIAASCSLDVDQMDKAAEKAFGLYKTSQVLTGNLSTGKPKK